MVQNILGDYFILLIKTNFCEGCVFDEFRRTKNVQDYNIKWPIVAY